MLDFINSWVEGIIIAVIIGTLIEMILPNSTIKKYVRTVIGTYIVFAIISPIITKISGKEINLSSYKLPENQTQVIANIDTNAYIESTYINTIKQDIIKNIENKGYKVENMDITINNGEENYGTIQKIKLKLTKQNKEIGNIEPIEINIENTTATQETVLDNAEIQNLKTFLQETYGAQEISIN